MVPGGWERGSRGLIKETRFLPRQSFNPETFHEGTKGHKTSQDEGSKAGQQGPRELSFLGLPIWNQTKMSTGCSD